MRETIINSCVSHGYNNNKYKCSTLNFFMLLIYLRTGRAVRNNNGDDTIYPNRYTRHILSYHKSKTNVTRVIIK